MRKRIGVMVPSTNTTCEADFQAVLPPGVTVHGQRLWLTNELLGEAGMERMNAEIETGARYLATAGLDVIAYGCTTGSFFRGPGWDRELMATIRREAGVPGVSTSAAVVDALRHFGARRLSVATPYPPWNNEKLIEYLQASGFEVLNLEADAAAAASGNQGINDREPQSIVEFATRHCHPDADALLCSCTAWRSVEVVEEIERRVGVPVVTSNQAAIWASLGALGELAPRPGYGRLLREIRPMPVAA